LAVIATNCIVTRISDNVDQVWVLVVDGAADRGIPGQEFDIVKGFLFHWSPPEFCALPDEARQYNGTFRKGRDKLSDVIDKAIEGPHFSWAPWCWLVKDLLDLGESHFDSA